MTSVTPQLGVKMSPAEAKTFVDSLNQKVIQRWDERVTKGQFMTQFVEGRLPLSRRQALFQKLGKLHRRN